MGGCGGRGLQGFGRVAWTTQFLRKPSRFRGFRPLAPTKGIAPGPHWSLGGSPDPRALSCTCIVRTLLLARKPTHFSVFFQNLHFDPCPIKPHLKHALNIPSQIENILLVSVIIWSQSLVFLPEQSHMYQAWACACMYMYITVMHNWCNRRYLPMDISFTLSGQMQVFSEWPFT